MANEITITAGLSAFKSSVMAASVGRSIVDLLVTLSGTTYIQADLSVTTTATVIPLGSVSTPGWFFAKNTDTTNYVTIRNGSSGADVARLNAGEIALFRWHASATPYAIANTATCIMEYILLSS